MARRLVSVQLELLAQQYLREGRQVLATTVAAEKAVDDLGDKADAASRDMLGLATTTEVAKKQVDGLGDEARGTARDLTLLQSRIDATKLKIRQMGAEFVASGDMGLLGDIGQERSMVAKLEKLLKEMKGPKQPPSPPSIFAAIPDLGGVPGPAVAAIGAGVVALAPFLGGVIAATVLGGVGTGGLIGGIALAAQDSRVKSAFTDLGHTMFTELSDAASPFVQPLVEVAHRWGEAWQQELPGVRRDFAVLAQAVDPIADGLAGFVHELHPGLSNALRASMPLGEQFGHEMTELGKATSDFLDETARSAPGAKRALHDFFTVFDAGLRQLGDDIHLLSESYELIRKFGFVPPPVFLEALSSSLPTTLEHLLELGGAYQGNTTFVTRLLDPAEQLNRELKEQTEQVNALANAWDSLNKMAFEQLDAPERWEAAIDDLTKSVEENGRTLDIGTEKGRANREAIEEMIRATQDLRQAGLLTDQQYQAQIKSIEAMGTKLGLSRAEVDKLIEAFKRMPSQIITDVIVRISSLVQGAFGIPAHSTAASIPATNIHAHQQLPALASGGDVLAGHAYIVGDAGRPEVFSPATNGTVYPSMQSYAAAGGSQTIRVIVQDTSGRTLRNTLIGDAQQRGVQETTIQLAYP